MIFMLRNGITQEIFENECEKEKSLIKYFILVSFYYWSVYMSEMSSEQASEQQYEDVTDV